MTIRASRSTGDLFHKSLIQSAFSNFRIKKGSYQVVALHAKGLRHRKKKEHKMAIYPEDLVGKIEGSLNFIIQRKRSAF